MSLERARMPPDLTLSDSAIDWLVRLNSGTADAATDDAFRHWRGQSPQHEAAAQEAEAIWHGLGTAGPQARAADRKAGRRKLTRRAVVGGGALALAGLALAGGGLRRGTAADYATGTAETRDVTLPDGSHALLNASSALALAYTATGRAVTLLEGQALFTVAPDAARPFVVAAGTGWTRAVGTAFDVDMRPDGVVVTVVEGVVAVGTRLGPPAGVTVRADQCVRYGPDGGPAQPQTADATIATAWRRGKLIFNRRPLVDVVAELQRHSRARIVIAGSGLQALEVTGVFDLNDPQAVLDTIEETLPVRVLRLPFLSLIL